MISAVWQQKQFRNINLSFIDCWFLYDSDISIFSNFVSFSFIPFERSYAMIQVSLCLKLKPPVLLFWKKLFWEFCYIPRNTSTVESISSNDTWNSLRILTLNHKATLNYFSNKIDTSSEVRDDSAFQTQDEGWGERAKAFVGVIASFT